MRTTLMRALEDGGGLLVMRRHRGLRSAVWRAHARGDLVRVHRGIYVLREAVTTRLRCVALALADPDLVFTGRTAAWLSGQGPEPRRITAVSRRFRRNTPHVEVRDRLLDPDHVVSVDGLRVTDPACTALELARATRSPDPLDEALRRRVPLQRLWVTFGDRAHRPGNRMLRRFLHDSRDEPWSAAERRAHQLLRRAGLGGWSTNRRVTTLDGTHYLDIAFGEPRVALEIDGFEHHSGRAAFERDRERDVGLAISGWSVHRFAAAFVFRDPEGFVQRVKALVGRRSRGRTPAGQVP